MEESAFDLANAGGWNISPMPPEAWALLIAMVVLVIWGIWDGRQNDSAKKRDR
jgi:hypothetical protein